MDTKLGWRGLGGGVALGICLLLAPQARAETDEAAEPMAAVFDLPNPPEIRSVRGLLDTTFVAKLGEVTVGGQTFTSNDYNRLYIPPTLRVKRGDRIRLQLVNRIQPADVEIDAPQPTNIHFHGMDVTPLPPGDNVFVRVEPGKAFNYDFLVPANHPEGLHWYHSHLHTVVDPQILSGLSGMLIVDGGIESHYPEFAGLKERVMVLKDVNLPGSSAPSLELVKGLSKSFGNTMTSTLWRFVEQAHGGRPIVALVTGHPHPTRRKADFDAANPCRYCVESPPFRERFGALREVDLFTAIVGYCGSQRGGSLGRSEVLLQDLNGDRHSFEFETFFNSHEALTLGSWLRPYNASTIMRSF